MKKSMLGIRGYSIGELIIVIVCIGLLTGIISMGFNRVPTVGKQEAAVAKARVLNAARSSYQITVPNAAASWAAAPDDAARVTLLVSANCLDGNAANFLTSTGGYVLSLSGALNAKTVLRKGGTELAY